MFYYYNIADNTTGEIIAQIGVDDEHDPNGVTDNTPAGATAYVGLPTDTSYNQYYLSGVITDRPEYSSVGSWDSLTLTADGVDSVTFGSGLPNPTTVIVIVPRNSGIDQPAPIIETSGSFTLTTTFPGKYEVSFSGFPYKGETYEIIAT